MSCVPISKPTPNTRRKLRERKCAVNYTPDVPIAFPEGPPAQGNPLELLLDELNRDKGAADTLARLDDFAIHTVLERKCRNPQTTDHMKFSNNLCLSNTVSLEICRGMTELKTKPFEAWRSFVKELCIKHIGDALTDLKALSR